MIHARSLYIIFAFFGVLAISVFPVTAYAITNFSLDKAPVYSGDSTNIFYEIIFAGYNRSTDESFPCGSDLVMNTDLDNTTWNYTIIANGYKVPRTQVGGKILELSGFILSYPSSMDASVQVHLNGTAPEVHNSSEKNLIKIQEIDSHDDSVNEFGIHWTIFPVR